MCNKRLEQSLGTIRKIDDNLIELKGKRHILLCSFKKTLSGGITLFYSIFQCVKLKLATKKRFFPNIFLDFRLSILYRVAVKYSNYLLNTDIYLYACRIKPYVKKGE